MQNANHINVLRNHYPFELHRDELMADWELAVNGEEPYKITPL